MAEDMVRILTRLNAKPEWILDNSGINFHLTREQVEELAAGCAKFLELEPAAQYAAGSVHFGGGLAFMLAVSA